MSRTVVRVAGYSGWDPPDDEELAPYELYEDALKLLPHGLQRELAIPKKDERTGPGDLIITLKSEAALSPDSGISLSAERTVSDDADEEGAYRHTSDKLDYTLWVDRKDWTGASISALRGHLQQFQKALKVSDREGFHKFR